MTERSLRAVIFDMDGVITATVELHYQSWFKALTPYGIKLTRDQNDRLRSLTRPESLERILNGRLMSAADRLEILQKKNVYYLEMVDALNEKDLLPGVAELFAEIRHAGLPIGVASASSNTRIVLARLAVLKFIQVIQDANDIPVSKPAPDIYLRTASLLQVPPAGCLAFDDSPAGIEAAYAAGMCPIGIGRHASGAKSWSSIDTLKNVRLAQLEVVYEKWVSSLSPGPVRVIGETPQPKWD